MQIQITGKAVLLIILTFIMTLRSNSECQPQFPYRQGWLGGDNVLSLALTGNKTLWLFSDSFIGPAESKDRSLSTIIANTAAISICENDKWETQYFWRSGRKSAVKPIFDSFSDQYKYWPTELFEVNKTLYVVLHKVAPKSDSNEHDLFNFTLVGTTIAEIQNFRSTTPAHWEITYVEWPDIFDPNKWNGGMTVHGDYLYTFTGRDVRKYNLIRMPLTSIVRPDDHIEYFSDRDTWESGYDYHNAKMLMEGIIGGSVIFHQEIGKWVMICGPEFLSNEIHIRTAENITGPWSAPGVFYRPPEQLPESGEYHPSYFCYGAREHLAYYDKKNGSLLVTYDCNSSDLKKLVSTMEINSLRMVIMKLK